MNIGKDDNDVTIHEKLDSMLAVFKPVKEEMVIGDLVFTQYQNSTELNETLTIDIKEMLPGYYHLSKDHFRYEITEMCPTTNTAVGSLNIDGTTKVMCRMPELSYDNSTGIVSVLGGWLRVQGTVGYTRYLAFKNIRVFYRGLD